MKLSKRFEEALAYACELHADQLRKGTEVPYVAHLLAVASIALENGASEDAAIAALLHDAVEDQGGEAVLTTIRDRFGALVADTVDQCTDAYVQPKPPWRERKERYLAHLPEASPEARLVSASDKLHNARAILSDYRKHGDALFERFKGGKAGTLWYYRALTGIFTRVGPKALAVELDLVVSELERVTETVQPQP